MSYPILMYHQVRRLHSPVDPMRGLCVDPDMFHGQMSLLKRFGYQGLSIRELQAHLRAPRHAKVFGITFDDGFANVFENAMPVLDALGFTATCYFVADRLGGENDWDAHLEAPPERLMYRDELLTWMQRGHEVGAHTLDHVSLPALSSEDAIEQIVGSKRRLEAVCGVNVEAFCYPYGNLNRQIRDSVEHAGYRSATTTRRGRASGNSDPFLLPRLAVAPDVGPYRLLFKCITP